MAFWLGVVPLVCGSMILIGLCAVVLVQCRESIASSFMFMGLISSAMIALAPVGMQLGMPIISHFVWLIGVLIAVPVAIGVHHTIRHTQDLAEHGEDMLRLVAKPPVELHAYSSELQLRDLEQSSRSLANHLARLQWETPREPPVRAETESAA